MENAEAHGFGPASWQWQVVDSGHGRCIGRVGRARGNYCRRAVLRPSSGLPKIAGPLHPICVARLLHYAPHNAPSSAGAALGIIVSRVAPDGKVAYVFTRSTWHRLIPLHDFDDSGLIVIDEDLENGPGGDFLGKATVERRYPTETIARLGEIGVWRFFVEDETHSPNQASLWHLNSLSALLAQRSGSLAITLGINGLALLPLHLRGSATQISFWSKKFLAGKSAAMGLSEWDYGSDLANNETRASEDRDHYVINGEKRPLNQARQADIITVLARTSEAPSAALLGASAGMSIFMIERDDTVVNLDRIATLPMDTADIAGFKLENTRVPISARIGDEGEGFSIAMKSLAISRGGIAAFPSGTTTSARRLAARYATERHLYGKPIVVLPAIERHLLRCAAFELAVNCLAMKATAIVNTFGQRAAYYTSTAKYICSKLGELCVDEGRQILGARALIVGEYETLVRDAILYGVFDGTSHVVLDGLRHLIRQVVARPTNIDDVFTDVTEAYRVSPVPIKEATRRRGRLLVASPGEYARKLAQSHGDIPLEALVKTAECLTRLVALSSGNGAFKEQTFAFDATDAVTRVEAAFAVAELGDPGRRKDQGLRALSATHCEHSGMDAHRVATCAIGVLSEQAASSCLRLAAGMGQIALANECVVAIELSEKLARLERSEA